MASGKISIKPKPIANGDITSELIAVEIIDQAVDARSRTVILATKTGATSSFSYIANINNYMYGVRVTYSVTNGTLSFPSTVRGIFGSAEITTDVSAPLINKIYEI